VTSWTILDGLLQPSLQPEELLWAEEVCKKDAKVKEACDAIGVDQQNIAVDGEFESESLMISVARAKAKAKAHSVGWCIGQDERFPGRRLQQCFIFARLRPDDNLYAHPCDFVPVLGELCFGLQGFHADIARLPHRRSPLDRLPSYKSRSRRILPRLLCKGLRGRP
jgi:Cu2+-containing amine oxidase